MSIPLRFTAAVALLLALSQTATAAPQVAGHACASIRSTTERLACYDAAFPPVANPVDVASVRKQALEDFGLNKAQLRDRDPEGMQVASPDRIQGTIARFSERANGQRVVTLESGQVWLLTEVTMKGHLRVGDPVTIREAALGSHMLLTQKKVALRAKRIQ